MNLIGSKYVSIALIFGLLLLVSNYNAFAQKRPENMPEHDLKPYYFGLSFGFNMSTYKVSNTPTFGSKDSFDQIQPGWGPDFLLGLMGNLRLTKFIDLRFIPSLVFAEKRLNIVSRKEESVKRKVESIYMHLPIQLKFKSDRIHNFRFYGMIGGKYDYDLASNARSRRQDEWLRISPHDVGLEIGFGFDFFYPNFIFTPEIKLSQGFLNNHFKDSDISLSNNIDKIRTRMIVLSINIQG